MFSIHASGHRGCCAWAECVLPSARGVGSRRQRCAVLETVYTKHAHAGRRNV